MKNFNALAASVPTHERKTATVDITDFVEHEEGERELITFLDPDTDVFYTAGNDVEAYQKLFPTFSAELATEIAILGLCHVEPEVGEESAGILYARICAKNPPLFLYIKNSFYREFPHLLNLTKAAQFRKNA